MLLSSRVITEPVTAWDGARAGIIIVVAAVLGRLLARAVRVLLERRESSAAAARIIGRVAAYVLVVAGIVYALESVHVQLGPLLGALGIGGIALAFALQDILTNVAAGVLLQVRRPFRVGEQVEVAGFSGRVEDVTLRAVQLTTFDGLTVFLPNSSVLRGPISNYTRTPTRRTTLEIGVSYTADLDEVCRVLREACAGVEGVLPHPAVEAWVTGFAESSVSVDLRFWHDARQAAMFRTRSAVAVAAKRALDAAGVDIPFPQRVVTVATDRVSLPR